MTTAALDGDCEAVRALLAAGFPVNACGAGGSTALHHAAMMGHDALVRELLAQGADVDAADEEGWTPLHFSTIHADEPGPAAAVQALLAAGASPASATLGGSTPLHFAALNGRLALVREYLQRGAAVDAADGHGCTPLHLACSKAPTPPQAEVVRALLEAGAAVAAASESGATPLVLASGTGATDAVRELLALGAQVGVEPGADPCARAEGKALRAAASGGHGAVVEMLTVRAVLEYAALLRGELEVHGTVGEPKEDGLHLLDREIVTEAVVEEIVAGALAWQQNGNCGPMVSISFCHLLPRINGGILKCILPLIVAETEHINLDGQPQELEEVRGILATLATLPLLPHGKSRSISLLKCGVPRAEIIKGFSAEFLSRLTIYTEE